MAVNNVQAVPMSRTEHAVRTIGVLSPAVPAYDIGKALLEGKTFGEAFDSATENMKTVQERNRNNVKEAYDKTCEQTKDMPWYEKYCGGLAFTAGRFIKNLFE